MQIQPINKRITLESMRTSKALVWPSNITWMAGDKPLPNPENVEFFRVHTSWDGYTSVIAMPKPTSGGLRRNKPRMWWCTTDRLWKCQRGFIQGRGTTQSYAYHDCVVQTTKRNLWHW